MSKLLGMENARNDRLTDSWKSLKSVAETLVGRAAMNAFAELEGAGTEQPGGMLRPAPIRAHQGGERAGFLFVVK